MDAVGRGGAGKLGCVARLCPCLVCAGSFCMLRAVLLHIIMCRSTVIRVWGFLVNAGRGQIVFINNITH